MPPTNYTLKLTLADANRVATAVREKMGDLEDMGRKAREQNDMKARNEFLKEYAAYERLLGLL